MAESPDIPPAPQANPPPAAEDQLDVPFAAIWYWTFTIFAYVAHVTVLTSFIIEALKAMAPTFSDKLAKKPGIGAFVRVFPALDGLTVAHLTAYVMLFGLCYFWREMLRMHLQPSSEKVFEVEPYKMILVPAGVVLVIADAVLFIVGLSIVGTGKPGVSIAGVLLAVIFTTLLVYVSLVSLRLKKAMEEEERRNTR